MVAAPEVSSAVPALIAEVGRPATADVEDEDDSEELIPSPIRLDENAVDMTENSTENSTIVLRELLQDSWFCGFLRDSASSADDARASDVMLTVLQHSYCTIGGT